MTAVIICIPLLSALAGWITIQLPFYLVFHPRKPWKIAGLTIQGVYYKKEQALKTGISTIIKNEFLSSGDFAEKMASPHNLDKLRSEIEQHIDLFLKVKLKEAMPMIGMLIGDRTTGQLKGIFMQEMELLFPSVMKSYVQNLKESEDLELMIREKLNEFPAQAVSDIFYFNTKKPRRLLGWIGLITGFLVGCLQLLIIFFSSR